MGAYKSSVRLRLAITSIRDGRRQSPVPTSPIEVRNKVEVIIEGRLRLFPDHAEDLVNGEVP
jgi:hypothetical protein